MKVAIVYDRVNKFGGAERVLLAIRELFPKAPLYTSVYDSKNAQWARKFSEVKTSFLQKIPFAKNNHELLPFLMPLAFIAFNFDEYDLVISVTSEFAKNINVKNGKHICYCLTPTRYLWSHHGEYFGNKKLRRFLLPLINYLKIIDKRAAKKPDQMIAISTEVQERIKKYYKREGKIIFPPVNLTTTLKRENLPGYYLVVSRLVKYKKVDLVIKAFNELDLPLVIIGTGREEKKMKKLAGKNISFAGFVSEKDLAKYYMGAHALIFPQKEDFGLTSVEAQSYGVPVIAYKEGGAMDTVIANKTGILFDEQNVKGIVGAVKKFKKMKFNQKMVIKNAERFSKDRFKDEFLKFVKEVC